MRFNYNNYMLEQNRVIDVINDIKNTYPEIPYNYARIIASLENAIPYYEYNPLIEFNRLYNMLFILEGDDSLINTIDSIKKRMKEVYINIINLRIDNNKMIKINNVMREIINYSNGGRIIFPTMNEFN